MEITWAGFLFLPLTFFLFLPSLRLSKILFLTIFFLPFGAISVINLPAIPPGFGVGLDRYFSAILVIAVLLFPVVGKIKLESIPKKIKISFCLFFFTILASLVIPINPDGIAIWQRIADEFVKMPLVFLNRNISKTIEILFSALFFMSIYKVMPLVPPKRLTRVLILSLFVMSASAFLDFLPSMTSAWQVIKNNISHPKAVGLVVGMFGEPRLSGLSIEPSHLIIYAACGFSIMCGFVKNGILITNKPLDIGLLVFFSVSMFLTFSSTMVVVFLLAGIYLMYGNKFLMNPKFIFSIFILFVLALIFHEIVENLFDVLIGNALGKMGISDKYGIYSEYRSFSCYAVIDVFKQSPIIGVGWGSILLPIGFPLLLLGSVGLLGTLACGYLIFSVFKSAICKLSKSNNSTERALREGLILCFSIITAMCLYTKGWQYFLFLPLVFFGASMCSNYGKCQPVVDVKKL